MTVINNNEFLTEALALSFSQIFTVFLENLISDPADAEEKFEKAMALFMRAKQTALKVFDKYEE